MLVLDRGRRGAPFFPSLVLASLMLPALAGCRAPIRHDVVLITIDTLRPDHLGFLGYPRDTAPYLSSLARGSVVFRRAFSTSTWTAPATASLLTSRHPQDHGVRSGFFVDRKRASPAGATAIRLPRLPDSMPTLPEFFHDHGYETFGITANVNVGPEIGFDRGFDHFARLHRLERRSSAGAEEVEAQLDRWRDRLRDAAPRRRRPRFVYLHFNDPHLPYDSGEPWPAESASPSEAELRRNAYDGEIRHLDGVLARVLRRFEWEGRAILVVVSDHGEEFLEHGGFGHPVSLYGELLRVLFLLRAPGLGAATVDSNTSLLDVAPTVAELSRLDPLPEWRGRSLASLARDPRGKPPAAHAERPLYAVRGRGARERTAVIAGDWKLIRRRAGAELYDVAADPLDQTDLAAEHPTVVRELASRLQAAFAGARPAATTGGDRSTEVPLDAEKLETLRSLGYVD